MEAPRRRDVLAFRQLSKYMVFLSSNEPVVAYGVLALFDPFEVVIGPYLPRMVKTILLPFRGRIVYDGLITSYNLVLGVGIKRRLNESYKEAKERSAIVTSLPFDPESARRVEKGATPRGRATKAGNSGVRAKTKEKVRERHDEVVALTDAFCRENLDEEYGALCRKLAGILARKRPSPLARGKPESWAGGIVRVVGWVNFLGDPSQPHHMKMTDIDEAFGVSEATGSAKSMAVRDQLRIDRLDPEWTLPSRMDDNPVDLAAGGRRPAHGHPHLPKGGAGRRLREGPDPLHPCRPGGRGRRGLTDGPEEGQHSHASVRARRRSPGQARRP